MTTIDLAVSGMTCSMCVAHVTEALNGVAGVSAVEVSLKDGEDDEKGQQQHCVQ